METAPTQDPFRIDELRIGLARKANLAALRATQLALQHVQCLGPDVALEHDVAVLAQMLEMFALLRAQLGHERHSLVAVAKAKLAHPAVHDSSAAEPKHAIIPEGSEHETVAVRVSLIMHKIAFVVPTKDRADDLRSLLASISAQTRKPDQLIVVDGSDPDVRQVVDEFPALHTDYVRVFPPSLSQQRNAGMQRLRPEITLAGYLDDDIVVEPDAIAKMLAYWESAPSDIGGAAFNIVNAPKAERWLKVKQALWIDSPRPGRMLPSGFASTLGFQAANIESDFLYGGASIWRREVIKKYRYDEWFTGTGLWEDVDYSYTVRESYRLVLVADARLSHFSPPVRPDREFLLGTWQVVNRMYFVRKHRQRGLSVFAGWIASFGIAMLNLASAIRGGRKNYWLRARGNLAGILAELAGRRDRIGGHLK